MNLVSQHEIEETLDWEAVWKIVHDPSVFDRVCDDQWTAKPQHVLRDLIKGIVENPNNRVLLVLDNGEPVGCFICYRMGDGVFEVHTMLTSRCRGADAITAGKLGTQHMLELPEVKRLYSYCPANLPEAYLFARYCGWHKNGVAKSVWRKDGVDYPMRIVEMTKEDLQCH